MRTISLEEEVAYLAAASEPLKDIARIILDTGMRPKKCPPVRPSVRVRTEIFRFLDSAANCRGSRGYIFS